MSNTSGPRGPSPKSTSTAERRTPGGPAPTARPQTVNSSTEPSSGCSHSGAVTWSRRYAEVATDVGLQRGDAAVRRTRLMHDFAVGPDEHGARHRDRTVQSEQHRLVVIEHRRVS